MGHQEPPPASDRSGAATIAVIIPVYNSADTLLPCLEALSESTYPAWTCIVVDDGSAEDVRSVADRFGARVIRVANGPRGPAYARNAGAVAADGEILFFVDADVAICPDTLQKIADTFAGQPGVAAVFGSYDEDPAAADFVSQFKNLHHHFVHQHANKEGATFWSGCGAIRRDVFMSAGGFDHRRYTRPCIEDIELGYRLRAAGHRLLLNKDIQVKHLKHWTLRGMTRADVFDRGLPWTLLILQNRHLPNDLNLHVSQRISAALACLGLLYAGLVACVPDITASPLVVAVALIVLLNARFYLFLVRKRGILFALAALPLHLFYYLYSVAALAMGTLVFMTDLWRGRAA